MMKLSDLSPLQATAVPTRALWYGYPGTGKTVAVAHMAKCEDIDKILWVEAEPGLKPAVMQRWGIDTDKLYPVRQVGYSSLTKLFMQIEAAVEKGERWGVIIDTLTNLQSAMLTQTVDASVKSNPNRKGEPTKPHLEDYGTNTEELRRLMRLLTSIPCHVGITCHVRDDVDAEGNLTGEIIPALTAKFGETLFGLVDTVVYTELGKGGQLGYVVPTSTRRAKDRDGVLPPVLPTPTFDRLHAYFSGALTHKGDELFKQFRKDHDDIFQRELRRIGRK